MLDAAEMRDIEVTARAHLAQQDPERYPVDNATLSAARESAEKAEARRLARRLPYGVGIGSGVVGLGGWGAAALAEAIAGPAGLLAATAGAPGLTAAALIAARVVWRQKVRPWRGEYVAGAAVSVGTVTALAVGGPVVLPWLVAPAVAGFAAASARWRREHREPLSALPPSPVRHQLAAPSAPVGEDTDGDTGQETGQVQVSEGEGTALLGQVRNWVLSGQAAPLPGATTEEPTRLQRGWRFTIRLSHGDYFLKVAGARHAVAGALLRPASTVLLEPHAGGEHLASLTVLTEDVLSSGVPYTGPEYRDGRIRLGLFEDGEHTAEFVACDHTGTYGGVFTGDPGSGKSTMAEQVFLGLRDSRQWILLFADGDVGAGSSNTIAGHADWPTAEHRQVLKQLDAVEGALEARQMMKATLTVDPVTRELVRITDPYRQRPASMILPSHQFPGIMWFLDEAYRFAQSPFLAEHGFIPRLEEWKRSARKYGMGIVWVTNSLLVADYGTSVLMGMLQSHNLFACRTYSSSEYVNIGGVTVRPANLPGGGGYAYAAQSGRAAQLRGAFAEDMTAGWTPPPRARMDEGTWLGMASHWPQEERDPLTAYREAVAREQEWRRKKQEKLWRTSNTPAPRAADPAPDTGPATGEATEPPVGLPCSTGNAQLDALAGQIPSLATVHPLHPPEPEVEAESGAGLTRSERAVLDAVTAGCTETGAIAEHAGLPKPTVSTAARYLAARGLITDGGYGKWLPAKQDGGMAQP